MTETLAYLLLIFAAVVAPIAGLVRTERSCNFDRHVDTSLHIARR